MAGAVSEFIDRKWPLLLSQIEFWRAGETGAIEILGFAESLLREWEQIPQAEKQIRYLELEPTFWASVNSLHFCAKWSVGGVIGLDRHPDPEGVIRVVNGELDDLLRYLRERRPIPEGKYVDRRHLP